MSEEIEKMLKEWERRDRRMMIIAALLFIIGVLGLSFGS